MRFDHLTTEQGLSQDIVTSIVQDRQGFMWFGTEDGLNRYDGYSIKVYKHDPFDSTSLASSWVSALLIDDEETLWIGGHEGLDRYDPDRDLFVHHRNNPLDLGSISSDYVSSLSRAADNSLWVGTSNGLNKCDQHTGKFVRYQFDPADPASLSSDAVSAVYLDADRALWVGTTNGLNRLIPSIGKFQYYPATAGSPQRFAAPKISAIFEDSRRNLWIAQFSTGLFRFDQMRSTLTSFPVRRSSLSGPADSRVFSIAEDHTGKIWFGHFSGLDIYDYAANTFTQIQGDAKHPQSLGSNRIYNVCRDRADALWLGTWQGGVNRFDPNRPSFSVFRHVPGDPNSLGADQVLSILEDRNGEIWAGTAGGGLTRFDPRTRTYHQYMHRPGNIHSISSNTVAALAEDPDGDIWAGCVEEGTLDRFDRHRSAFIHYPLKNIQTLCIDRNGDLWIGMIYTGLAHLDRRRDNFSYYSDNPSDSASLRGRGVWCIYEDRAGALWVGTWEGNAQFNRLDRATGHFAHFSPDPRNFSSISSTAVRTAYEDKNGCLWLGTWGGGLNKYDPLTNVFSHLTERDGLPNNFVKGILADSQERLWISTDRGLTRFDPHQGQFKNFTPEDGLQGYRFLSGSFHKGWSGRFYFGGEHGFNTFFPDSVRDNPYVPPVVITKFTIFDRPALLPRAIWATDEIRLSHDQAFFAFEFVALDYSSPTKNRYAYMMDGFDRDWVQSGSRRYAAYTHLEPGSYVFRVRGSNNHGIWNDQGASLRIIITPPFWRQWWFYLLSFLLIATALYALYRYRVQKIVDVERLRTRIASDLHDEIASNLTSIAMFSKIVEDTVQGRNLLPEQHVELLGRITTLSQESVSKIRDIIWAIDPRTQTLSDLLQRVNDTSVAECLAHNIILYTQRAVDDRLPTTNLLPEQRRHIWLVLKEAIHNAIKHASCSEIVIAATYSSPLLTLTIHDNGHGFDGSSGTEGKGLGTMRMRAEQLGGELLIETGKETGTRLTLKMKL